MQEYQQGTTAGKGALEANHIKPGSKGLGKNCKNAKFSCHLSSTEKTDLYLADLVEGQGKEVDGVVDEGRVRVQVAILFRKKHFF